jgi:hypothetical protein
MTTTRRGRSSERWPGPVATTGKEMREVTSAAAFGGHFGSPYGVTANSTTPGPGGGMGDHSCMRKMRRERSDQ